MAKKEPGCNYSAEIRKLKTSPPERIYFLFGEEDYLRGSFLAELKRKCLPEGENGFSYKRFDGPGLSADALSGAVSLMPFLSERTLVELRDMDLNKLPEADGIISVLEGIPEYCTVVFVPETGFEPDGRLKLIRFLKQKACWLCFSVQGQESLGKWIKRRFQALDKEITPDAIDRLTLISGVFMSRLIPEIEKVAAYAPGAVVGAEDVEAVASHIPEADVFEMVNLISEKKYDGALHLLAELLKNKENAPVGILATLSYQFRRILGVKLALQQGKRKKEIMELFSIRWDGIADRMILSAGRFTFPQLRAALENCAAAEYQMKTSSVDDNELLKQIIIGLILVDAHG